MNVNMLVLRGAIYIEMIQLARKLPNDWGFLKDKSMSQECKTCTSGSCSAKKQITQTSVPAIFLAGLPQHAQTQHRVIFGSRKPLQT